MNLNSLHKDQEAIQTPEIMCGTYLKHCVTNVNHAIPSAMSGFITELITSVVYCYFLLSVSKDREAIQMPEMLVRNMPQILFNEC